MYVNAQDLVVKGKVIDSLNSKGHSKILSYDLNSKEILNSSKGNISSRIISAERPVDSLLTDSSKTNSEIVFWGFSALRRNYIEPVEIPNSYKGDDSVDIPNSYSGDRSIEIPNVSPKEKQAPIKKITPKFLPDTSGK